MAKGYWIAHVDVQDVDDYQPYVAANPAILARYGGRFIVRGGAFEPVEGQSRSRTVIVEFPDYAAALACYNSPEYQENAAIRKRSAISDLIVIEGHDGPQPGDE
ncbi:MAG: DUF1330 domain-containing protein [Hyphomicrobiales bacterium]|nr:DUF1330 domain-containing protein [Hyphomicrobiales bacterium]